jgi:acyl-CoA thioesterase FadM
MPLWTAPSVAMPSISMPSFSSLASWRTLALVFALLNLKALPLAWHVRLFYRLYESWYSRARVQRSLQEWRSQPDSKSTYVLFEPVSITSRAPVLEIDYNFHKSNSTYFADLDESRTALMTKFLVPCMKQGNIELEKEGHRGRLAVVLGSVHTTFHREIKPYELYEVRSRVLGWDKKWIVIGSWFVRPGKKETLLASALSKYVVKKGRYTVLPERCFVTAGWIPSRPEGAEMSPLQGSEEPSIVPTPQEGLVAAIPTSLAPVSERLVQSMDEKTFISDSAAPEVGGEWDWHRIDKERARGLQLAANWLALDKELMEEFSRPSV